MTSEEIKEHMQKVMPLGDFSTWLREIAYQLAVMNERVYDFKLSDPQPGKRDAEVERREIIPRIERCADGRWGLWVAPDPPGPLAKNSTGYLAAFATWKDAALAFLNWRQIKEGSRVSEPSSETGSTTQKNSDSLSDPQPGKRDADSEPGLFAVARNAMQLLRELGFYRQNPNHPVWANWEKVTTALSNPHTTRPSGGPIPKEYS